MKQLAQVNISRLRAPLTDPLYQEFVAKLNEINLLAEQSRGFVWRLENYATESSSSTDKGDRGFGGATQIRIFNDDALIVNLTVWESIETLYDYVYKTAHTEIMRKRKLLFEPMQQPQFAMWWVKLGHIPSISEAENKLRKLQAKGESSDVFTFKSFNPNTRK